MIETPSKVWVVQVGSSDPDVWATKEDAYAAAADTIRHISDPNFFPIQDAWNDLDIVRWWNEVMYDDAHSLVTVREAPVLTRTP